MSTKNEYDELTNNDDEELLEESQARNSHKMVFVFLGFLSLVIGGSVFYFLLKNSEPPIQVQKIEENKVKKKKFIAEEIEEPIAPKITLASLPSLPPLPRMQKEKPTPKEYIPKLIKGAGSSLAISSRSSFTESSSKTSGSGMDDTMSKMLQYNQKLMEKALNTPANLNPNDSSNASSNARSNANFSNSKVKVIEPYTGGVSTVAGIHHYDPNLFLVRGTFIPCSMDVKLISMLGGQITCTVAEDIYSANGNVLLIEKGSTAVGSYKKTGLQNGMNRLYAIWEDIRTPNNIIISVGSGATDELGTAGMVGEVDNHWGMRVGGAILLSVIDDALSAAVSNLGRNNNYTVNNFASQSARMSEMMLRQYINIPPTLYKDQGDLINLYVNKDIDFSKVYKLKR